MRGRRNGRTTSIGSRSLRIKALRSRDCALTAAQPVIARIHGFGSRAVFAIHLEALASSGSPISNFETAVDAKSPRADARMVAALRTGVA